MEKLDRAQNLGPRSVSEVRCHLTKIIAAMFSLRSEITSQTNTSTFDDFHQTNLPSV